MRYRIALPCMYVVIRTAKFHVATTYLHCEMSRCRQIQRAHKPVAEIMILF
jgi:hypothetical protein